MARKSRRHKPEQPVEASKEALYPTAIYARLSVENGGRGDDNSTIENQIDVCKEYLTECSDLELIEVYQDNGWSGTNMERPAFEKMMDSVRSGEINTIVVRDLSRFGRNYIETGTYLERIFPKLGVRFISVKERFDSLKVDGSNESLVVPLQNLINDLYAKDISRKIESANRARLEAGTYKWTMLAYGYKWNENHTEIIPNEDQAEHVKSIFSWFHDGVAIKQIVARLNAAKVPRASDGKCDDKHCWKDSTIRGILKNPIYTGRHMAGKHHGAYYLGIKSTLLPEEEWFEMLDTHQPLVSDEVFEEVKLKLQKNSEKRKQAMEKTGKLRRKLPNLFEEKLVCADCGYRMYYVRNGEKTSANYYCSSYQRRKYIGCSSHSIPRDMLYEKVFETIKLQIRVAAEYEEVIKLICSGKKERKYKDGLDSKIISLSREIGIIQRKRTDLYESYTEGILDKDEYVFAKDEYESKYLTLSDHLDQLRAKRKAYEEVISNNNRWICMMRGLRLKRKLTKELIDETIDQVRVFEDRAIEIVFNYQDVYDLTKDILGEGGDDSNE